MNDRGPHGRFVNLREYLEARLDDSVEKIESDRKSDNEAIKVALDSVSRERVIYSEAHGKEHSAHMREHSLDQKAIDLAAQLGRENKSESNEWRAAMSDKDKRFATSVELQQTMMEVQSLREANIVRTQAELGRTERDQQKRDDMEHRIARQQWVVGMVVAIAAILVATVMRLANVGG